jgi:hypothetical protein
VQHEQDSEDLIGQALRRAFRIHKRTDEKFEDLLRRLAKKEASARHER